MQEIPERLYEAIDKERGNLARARSLLACVALSIEDGGDGGIDLEPPDYGEVVRMACELIRASNDELDDVNLRRTLLGDNEKPPRRRPRRKKRAKKR